jgi:hypothetical protein
MTLFLAQLGDVIPLNPGTQQIAQYVATAITQLTNVNAPIFVAKAQTLLNGLGLFALVLGALLWVWGYLVGNHHYAVQYYVKALVAYLISFNLLKYYIDPMPLIGYSFSGIFAAAAGWLTAFVNLATVNQFFSGLNHVWANAERPGNVDLIGALYYVLLGLIIGLIEATAFGVILYSFIALGVGAMLGPFFVVCYLFPATRMWFWAWVNFMVKYSLFQVVAAIYVNVVATAGLIFIGAALHGDYSLGHLIAMFGPFLALMFIAVFGLLKIPALTSDLLTGGASAGGVGGAAIGYLVGKLR